VAAGCSSLIACRRQFPRPGGSWWPIIRICAGTRWSFDASWKGPPRTTPRRANKSDLKKIEGIIKRLIKAYESGERREEHQADADFHQAIAEASHNSMFLYLNSSILLMLREHISLNLIGMESQTREMADRLRKQHLDIWDAIRKHQPDAARQAMIAHIDFTWLELERRERGKVGQ
jgi:GntR family transcriptional repressor for pyruvate dehydrogenase complex